jgi:hypothetical protein
MAEFLELETPIHEEKLVLPKELGSKFCKNIGGSKFYLRRVFGVK